ncbi:isochorismatase [Auricularia subglabra TFB-10046 SS5]|nr:isochorismatase [Auricularia subglabra TFB-10046 SS5]
MSAPAFKYTRINRDDAAVLIVDIQTGLFQIVHDMDPRVYENNILAFSALAKYFTLPVVITTSAETSPNGPVPKEILADHPNVPYIARNGEVNAWDAPEFREAVRKTGKKQLILAGITTDVCVAFLALSLREAGYEVFVIAEASGTFDKETAALAHQRMIAAGVQVISLFVAFGDLMRDWRQAPGGPDAAQVWLAKWYPTYNNVLGSWLAAKGK